MSDTRPSPVSAPAAWAAASRSCSPMPAIAVVAGRLQGARRRGVREARSRGARRSRATRWRRSRSFGLFDRGSGRRDRGARLGRAGARGAGRALARAGIIFEGVPEVLDLKREALARGVEARRARHRSSPRPRRPSWSTISRARSNIRNASSTRTGSIRPIWCRWSRSRRAARPIRDVIARVKALLEGIGKVPVVCAAHAGLHRAAHPGARHERGGAHGRGRRRQRRGYRQGDQLRLRLPLRGARHAGVHRLGRRRHSLLCQPLSRRRARQRPLRARPRSIARNMRDGRIGMRTGAGFLDYSGLDVDAYRASG